jgi:hypothetical protein
LFQALLAAEECVREHFAFVAVAALPAFRHPAGRGIKSVCSPSWGVRLEEISDGNRAAVLALRVAPEQEQFVSSVPESLAEAAEYPHARP